MGPAGRQAPQRRIAVFLFRLGLCWRFGPRLDRRLADHEHRHAHCKEHNSRELEGAVTKVLGFASLSGQEVTPQLVRQCLRELFSRRVGQASIEDIMGVVTVRFGVKLAEQTAADGCFPSANLARNHGESAAVADSVEQMGEGFLVLHAVQVYQQSNQFRNRDGGMGIVQLDCCVIRKRSEVIVITQETAQKILQ